ncbi:MAG TPA: adenosine deaminase [Bryobacteraceae bacterium]|nr:adenosine deaminase [Bryobacteraceae bacterium]
MRESYSAWRKAELHLHLEGSVEPRTMRELAPDLSPQQIEELYRFEDFQGFLMCFKRVVERLRKPEDYALVTRRLLAQLAEEHVEYAEITISAGVVLWKKQDFAAVYEAIRESAQGSATQVRWILDAVRHFGVEHAMAVARLAAERVEDGVVAFGIGGDEARGPAEWFTEVFQFARDSGLRLTAHAGESAGPESVWGALRIGAERIGHGIRSIEDPELVGYLREQDVPLEVCITSNLATGAVGSLNEHPVRQLFEAGVPIILNTDDPALFGASLSGEFELAATCFGFSEAELRQIAANAFQYAFK